MPSPRYHAYPALPRERRRRRPRARIVLLGGAVLAVAVLAAVPALQPPVDLGLQQAPPAQAAAAQQPLAQLTPQPTTEAPAPTPTPASNRGPVGSTVRPAVIGAGRPPSRIAGEWSAPSAPSLDILAGYQWPLAHPRLTLPFGPTPWGSWIVDGEHFHDGIDIATFCGDRVRAAHAGTVIAAGRRFDHVMGWVGDLEAYYRRLDRKHAWMTLPIIVVIDDGNGYRSMYAHFGRLVVRTGQRVEAGELLGYEGMTGHASGCHVHYGLFSPWETATFRNRADVVQRMKLPAEEIARIDPLLVLPPKPPAQPRPTAPAPSPLP